LRFYIVIPAHNEEDYIGQTLKSLINQSLLPTKIVVVDDNSTDTTSNIVNKITKEYPWISLISNISSDEHIPGSKIINAFYKGYDSLDKDFDIICKYDADLIFPKNYLESLATHYQKNPELGMVAGHCYVQKNNKWQIENLTSKKHIRGPIKAYRKACFQ
jgi:glycosyltransferase involved in cell wall biosynthesis